MIRTEDLEEWRTLSDMKKFYHDIYCIIDNNEQLKCQARLKDKQYAFKELFEEYLPLINFAELYYEGQNIECRYLGRKTQNCQNKYDGEIRKHDNTIDKIEIVAPRDGELEKNQAIQLNKDGVTDVESFDLTDKYRIIKETILDSARKKAKKSYTDIILVIYFEFFSYVDPTKKEGICCIEDIVNELSQIDYCAKEVHFLVPPYVSSSVIYGGAIYKIK